MKKNLNPIIITVVLTALGLPCSLMAQTDILYRYSYSTGVFGSSINYTNGFSVTSTSPNAPTDMDGANWATLINSGRIWGPDHSPYVRAFDWVEDSEVNYLSTSGQATWYFSVGLNGNAQSGTSSLGTPGAFRNGPFDDQAILGNPNILAMVDDQVLLYDSTAASGSTALYLYNVNTRALTTSVNGFGFDTFTGGSFDGDAFASRLNRLIGVEDARLWYLDLDGSLISYSYTGTTSGAFDPTWTTLTGGLMDGMSLEAALDSGHYLGIGVSHYLYFTGSVIPEPSTYALLLAAGLIVVARVRRSQRLTA